MKIMTQEEINKELNVQLKKYNLKIIKIKGKYNVLGNSLNFHNIEFLDYESILFYINNNIF